MIRDELRHQINVVIQTDYYKGEIDVEFEPTAVRAILDLVDDYVDDVIGQDEPPNPEPFEDMRRTVRNEHRAEQRTKAHINVQTKKGGNNNGKESK